MKTQVAALAAFLTLFSLGCGRQSGASPGSQPSGAAPAASSGSPAESSSASGPAASFDGPPGVGLAPGPALPTLDVALLDDASLAEPPVGEDALQAAADANRFACDLYAQLRAEQGNLFFSPASITMAVALAYAGARGQTAAEIEQTLHFTLPPERLHPALGELFGRMQVERAACRVSVANRIWGRQGLALLGDYQALLTQHYAAPLETLDFAAQPGPSCDAINAWVAEQTQDKIPDLIPYDAIRPDTQFVLTNAVYFKGDWYSQFNPALTQPAPFHVSATDSVQTPLMFLNGDFRCGVVDGVQVLDLPYSENRLSMLVLLPAEVDGLTALEEQLTAERLSEWDAQLQYNTLSVYLPKFKLESSFELAERLQGLGLLSAFDAAQADFSGITGARDAFFSAVFHKAYVDVNEEGTEAAAATGMVAVRGPAPTDLQEFRADHPFAFLIRDNATGLILFAGRLVAPAAAE